VVGPVLAICAAGYFAYHAMHGERGFLTWLSLQQRVEEAEAELAEISAERRQFEHRVHLLRPDSLDPDLLEERARIMLNYGREGEIVIFDEPPASDAPEAQ
jgi:cell division protein FtsB